MKNKIIIIFFVLIIFVNSPIFAKTDDVMEGQKESFGISSFIKEAEKYSSDFFENTDISDILNNALAGKVDNSTIFHKVLNLLGKEAVGSLKTLVSILVIIIIHSIV